MRTRSARRFVAVAAAVVAAFAVPAAADASTPPKIVIEDGVTKPVFGYPTPSASASGWSATFDSENDGFNDRVAMDIIRPAATADGLKVPVIMDASPYYTTLGRGNEGECKQDADADGLNDNWPLFYDNYFVPRGYAVVLLRHGRHGRVERLPDDGRPGRATSAPTAGIDWLNGRRPGYDKDGNLVAASWHNGRTGMIGKSYDGTLANAPPRPASTACRRSCRSRRSRAGTTTRARTGSSCEGEATPRASRTRSPTRRPSRVLRDRPAALAADRRRRVGRLHAVLGRAATTTRTCQGQGERVRRPRDQRQQRHAGSLQQVVVRPGGEQVRAQDLARPRRATSTRSTSAATGSGRCTAGSTTSCRTSRTGSRTSRRPTIERSADIWETSAAGLIRTRARRRSS